MPRKGGATGWVVICPVRVLIAEVPIARGQDGTEKILKGVNQVFRLRILREGRDSKYQAAPGESNLPRPLAVWENNHREASENKGR